MGHEFQRTKMHILTQAKVIGYNIIILIFFLNFNAIGVV